MTEAKPKAPAKKAPKAVKTEAPTPVNGDSKAVVKERVGEVISDKMEKTIVVKVVRRVPHPRFQKIVKVAAKFYAHDEKKEAKVGDTVKIRETRPMSRLKPWELVSVMK